MKVKTAELTGAALDWAVAKCENLEIHTLEKGMKVAVRNGEWEPWWVFTPTSNWEQGGPIIEREEIGLWPDCAGMWEAKKAVEFGEDWLELWADSALVAAMRCYVSSKLGDEVEIPEELL